ncbi:AraC family transcriptional regulator [Neobacillus mesonae]|nr:AraC family transcriptional regulator [Neobacillus mesonae]
MDRTDSSNGRVQCSHHVQLPRIHIVGDIVKKPGTALGPRRIHDYELLFFPDSTHSVYRVDEQAFVLKEPSFILTRPGELHSYEYDPHQPARHLFIHFGFPGLVEAEQNLPLLAPGGPSCISLNEELPVGMMKQIMHIAYAYPGRLQARGSSLLWSLLTEINGHLYDEPVMKLTNRVPPQIVKALDYIDHHLEEPISVEQLSREIGWSHEHFTRSFVQFMGRSPRETIIHRRIDRACQLLLYEAGSIKDVAFAVGFSDENYFSRLFKSVKGLTASQYRKKYFNPVYRDLVPVKVSESQYPINRILYNIGAQ